MCSGNPSLLTSVAEAADQQAKQKQQAAAEAAARQAEYDRISRERVAALADIAKKQSQAEAQQQALVQAQAEQQQAVQQQAAQQQAQMKAQKNAQATALARQQQAQQAQIAAQQAQQDKDLTAQRLASGAVATSQRVLSQRPAGSGPTAAITAGESDVAGRRRRATAGSENLRVGSSVAATGAGLNIGA